MIKPDGIHEQQLQEAVGRATHLISHGDVFAQTSCSQTVAFEYDKLQTIDDVSSSSLGCRVFENGRVGNSFVNDPVLIEKMIGNARESALFGEKLSVKLPSASAYEPIPWLFSEKNCSYSKQDLKEIAHQLMLEVKKFAPQAKISTSAHISYSRFFLQNTEGFEGNYAESALYLTAGLFEIAPDGSFLEIYEGAPFYDEPFDFMRILEPLRKRVELSRSTCSVKSGVFPIIIAPSALDLVFDPLLIAANGKTFYKGISFFADKIDALVADEKLTLIDDPLYKYGSAAPFDDEGTVSKPLDIIRDGVFKNFIYDSATAQKMNTQTTGHATRSFGSLPAPGFTNRVIAAGDIPLKSLINSVDYGILLAGALGEGQSNVLAGDFSVLGESAFLIQNGVLKGRVKDTMISGNSFELLNNIGGLGDMLYQEGSLFAPYMLFHQANVSSK